MPEENPLQTPSDQQIKATYELNEITNWKIIKHFRDLFYLADHFTTKLAANWQINQTNILFHFHIQINCWQLRNINDNDLYSLQ